VKVASLGDAWRATGAGPLLLGFWGKLAVFPPFSWAEWLVLQIAAAPALYRYYLYYTLGSFVAKRLVPGQYAMIVTGTKLGLVKVASPAKYRDAVAERLAELLVKQAQLRAQPGEKVNLSPQMLDAARQRLLADPVLTEALGSTSALAIWHKLERTPLDDPKLLQDAPSASQSRWIVEALRTLYGSDIEAAARTSALEAAAENASKELRALNEAVSAAVVCKQHGVFEAGTGDGGLAEVEKASEAAAAALSELEKARTQAPENAAVLAQRRKDWEAKATELQAAHRGMPAVAAELQRLAGPAPPADNPPIVVDA